MYRAPHGRRAPGLRRRKRNARGWVRARLLRGAGIGECNPAKLEERSRMAEREGLARFACRSPPRGARLRLEPGGLSTDSSPPHKRPPGWGLLFGGDGGIRTLGRKLSLRRFSKPLVSATHPRLRDGLQATAYISGNRIVQPAPIVSLPCPQHGPRPSYWRSAQARRPESTRL